MTGRGVYDITNPIPITAKTVYSNEDNERSFTLWSHVLIRAKEDLYLAPDDPDNSLNWFLSASEDAHSCLWLCAELSIDAQAVYEAHATRIRTLLHIRYS